MIRENMPGENTEETYTRLHRRSIKRASEWYETGKNINRVTLDEDSLEKHFDVNWGDYNEYYHGELSKWWDAYIKRGELTVIEPKVGQKIIVLDEGNLVIAKPEDCIYFPKVKPCWVEIVDYEAPNGEDLRIAYHVPGNEDEKPVDVVTLIKEVNKMGTVKRISIFYNGSIQADQDVEDSKRLLPEAIPVTFTDLRKAYNWHAHDIYVSGNTAELHHNEGGKRVYSGKSQVFEAKV